MPLFTEFVNRQRGDAVICVTGPHRAGKSTFLRTVGQQDPELVQLAEDVNIATGYLVSIQLPDSRKLHLLEAPGALRSDIYTDLLGESFVGSVILVDRGRPEIFREARSIWAVADHIHASSVIAAGMRTEGLESAWSLEDLRLVFKFDADGPLLECDTRIQKDCIDTIAALLNVCASTAFVECLRTSFAQR
jgi:signal recognition particle receptor subunit beta